MPTFRSLLLIPLACGTVHSRQATTPLPAVDQERAKRLSALPLDSDNFKFSFRITDAGGAMLATATHPTEPDTEEHLQRRLIQLANLVVHCDFIVPEFRRAGSSQHLLTLCGSKPNIHPQVGMTPGPRTQRKLAPSYLSSQRLAPRGFSWFKIWFEPSPVNTEVANSTTLTANKEPGYGRRQVV